MSVFDPLRTLVVSNSKRLMRWVAALIALGLVGAAAFYLLAVRDRSFRSYAGAELRMPLGTALSRLQSDGYMIVHGLPQVRNRDCSDADKHTLVYAADPTFSLTITPDRSCKVSNIARRRRGMELWLRECPLSTHC